MITSEPGQSRNFSVRFLSSLAGVVQMQWAEDYGPAIRFIGPFGLERLLFLEPSALQRILVSEWINYPRVRSYSNVSF